MIDHTDLPVVFAVSVPIIWFASLCVHFDLAVRQCGPDRYVQRCSSRKKNKTARKRRISQTLTNWSLTSNWMRPIRSIESVDSIGISGRSSMTAHWCSRGFSWVSQFRWGTWIYFTLDLEKRECSCRASECTGLFTSFGILWLFFGYCDLWVRFLLPRHCSARLFLRVVD